MPWSEEVAIEIEALQATYADSVVVAEEQRQVSMCIQPQEEQQQHYVQCQLLLTASPDYPRQQAPAIQLQDVKGFVNRQEQLQQLLMAEAAELTGELLLGHLFEAAKAWLTEHDQPEGPCIFCLEDLTAAADSNTPTMRLPCFHAYHESCFAEWWCRQQGAYLQQQKALEEQTGATAAAALVREALPPKDDGTHFRLSCPTCRAPFQLQDLPGATQQQLQQLQAQQALGAKQQLLHPDVAKLTASQLQPFLQLQRQHAQLFARQQQRQGIIDTDVSICIADWEGPSSSSSSTATAAGAGGSAAAGVAGRGAHHHRDGVLPTGRAGRGRGSSSSSGGGGRSRGGSRGGRGRGRHLVRLSDGADANGWQEGNPQDRQPQQQGHQQQGQQQLSRGHYQQQQQHWRQEEQDWVPKHPRGGSWQQARQQRTGDGEKLQQPERGFAGSRGSRGRFSRGRGSAGAGRRAGDDMP